MYRTILLVAFSLVSGTAGLLAAEAPRLDKTDLFHAGQGGYETFRVPGIV